MQDNAVVDMYSGERYVYLCLSTSKVSNDFDRFCYADRSLVGAMAYEGHQRWYRITYDLWCQWKIHMKERITREKFPNLPEAFWNLLERVLGGIPTIHLLGHIWLYRALYAYAHMKGSGKTTGEMVETQWHETKFTSGSTKRENHGQRHDDLDAMLSDWNFNKLIKMGK